MCAYLLLEIVEENIEGDANLHHPSGIGLMESGVDQTSMLPSTALLVRFAIDMNLLVKIYSKKNTHEQNQIC